MKSQITPLSEFLVVHAGLTSDHLIPENLPLDQKGVLSLGIVLGTKGSNV
jgi:hypothetical protein